MCNQIIVKDLLAPYLINIMALLSENAKILFIALFIGPNGFCLLNVNFYDSEVYSLFKHNGFLHLFAISGSNLILLSSFIGMILKPLRVLIRTEFVRITLLVSYVVFLVGFDVIPAVRALTTEILLYILKRFGLKIEYKYITILLLVILLLIRVENVINISFLLTFGILIVSLLSVEMFLKRVLKKQGSATFIERYFYEGIFTFFYPILIVNNINLSFSQILFSLVVKEMLDVLAVFYYVLILLGILLKEIFSPVINLLVEIITIFLKFIDIPLLKLESSNVVVFLSLGLVLLLLLASVRKFVRESYLTKYVPVAQLDRARHS